VNYFGFATTRRMVATREGTSAFASCRHSAALAVGSYVP
jgi:hypothetical protein